MFRVALVACLIVVAYGDAAPKCTFADVKQVVGCVRQQYEAIATGCLNANKCPGNYWNGDRHDRKKRGSVPTVPTAPISVPGVAANASAMLPMVGKTVDLHLPTINLTNISTMANNIAVPNKVNSLVGDAKKTVDNISNTVKQQVNMGQVMNDCHGKVDDSVANTVWSCVFGGSINVTDLWSAGASTSPPPKNSFTADTCNGFGVDSCIDGRNDDDSFRPILNQCIKTTKITCDVQGIITKMGQCFDTLANSQKFDDISKVFSDYAKNKSISLNVTTGQIKSMVEGSRPNYQRAQLQPIPKKGCSAANVNKISQCVQRRQQHIEACYRSSGCPRPVPKAEQDVMVNMANITKELADCGKDAFHSVTQKFVACTKKNITDFDIDNNDDDDDDDDDSGSNESNEGNRGSNGSNGGSNGNSNSSKCDTVSLGECLKGRNGSDDMNVHAQICGDTCTDCDVKYTKSVACVCIKDQLVNPVNFNVTRKIVQDCAAKKKVSYLTPKQENYFVNMMVCQFCDGENNPASAAPPPPPTVTLKSLVGAKTTPKPTPKPTTKKPTTKKPTTKKPTTKKSG
jgi:hypothetical protein